MTQYIESVNYRYLGVSIVFLIFAYGFLLNTKNKIIKNNIKNNNMFIKTITPDGEIYMDIGVFEMHIKRLRDNLVDLYKNMDVENCGILKSHLDNISQNTKKFINENSGNFDTSFCNTENKLFDDTLLQEYTLLKTKLSSNTERDDTELENNIKYKIIEILLDMNIIIFLNRSSMCKKGSMNLSAIDQIITELYNKHCKEPFIVDSHKFLTYSDSKINTMLGIPSEQISRCVLSEQLSDTTSMPMRESYKKTDNVKSKIEQSQDKPIDQCDKIQLGKGLTYDSNNSLRWIHKIDHGNSDFLYDTNGRTSLLT